VRAAEAQCWLWLQPRKAIARATNSASAKRELRRLRGALGTET
jgi:hypothetical protein